MPAYMGVVAFLLGALIGMLLMYRVKHLKKHQGTMYASSTEEGTVTYTLELDEEPEGFLMKPYISFRVVPPKLDD